MTRPDYEDLDRQPRRRRTKRCAYDKAELVEQPGLVFCPECGKTRAEMVQAPKVYDTWEDVPSSATVEHAGQVGF